MNQQQNMKVPSEKLCIVEGHQNKISTNICIYDKCESNNRWICIRCVLQKKHSHNLEGDNHIVDQEMFYQLLKDKQDHYLKQIKEMSQQIQNFNKKLKVLVEDINLIQQSLEKEITDQNENKALKLIDQMIKITEEDFSQISNEQIVEFLDSNISLKEDSFQEFKLNMIRINESISDLITDLDQNYCSNQLLEKKYIEIQQLGQEKDSQKMYEPFTSINESEILIKKQQENGKIQQNNNIIRDQQQTKNNDIQFQQIEKDSPSQGDSPHITNSIAVQIKGKKEEEDDEGEWEDDDGEDQNYCEKNQQQNCIEQKQASQLDAPIIINQAKEMKEQEDDEGEWEDDEDELEDDDKQQKQDQPQISTKIPLNTQPNPEPQFNLLVNKNDQVQEKQDQVPSKKWLFDYIFKKV